jgi:hypothetical protein
MSPCSVRRRLRHQLMRLRIAERPRIRRPAQRVRVSGEVASARPRVSLRRPIAINMRWSIGCYLNHHPTHRLAAVTTKSKL